MRRHTVSSRAATNRSCEPGAVAPPIRQPAVLISGRNRRPAENVTVN